MVAISCPWCEEDVLLAMASLEEEQASFTCPDCGTSVAFVEEPTMPMDVAA